jgi:hypothetical protein
LPDYDFGSLTEDSTPQWHGPTIDPLPESRSLLLAGVTFSESVNANSGDTGVGSPQVFAIGRVLGSLNFLKVARRSETAVDLRGGELFSESTTGYSQPLEQLQAAERVFFKKIALTISDSLGNYPGGSFGSTWFGGASAFDLATTSVSASIPNDPIIAGFTGSHTFGIAQKELTNLALAEVTDFLTPRSAITFAGAYGIGQYLGDNPGFINSRQVSALVSYGHQLTPRSQIGALFGYQTFQFPQADAGNVTSKVAQFAYSRILSRRLDAQLGAGPDFTHIITPVVAPGIFLVTDQVNIAAFGLLSYHLRSGLMTLSYNRSTTNGSALFAGANRDSAEFTLSRRLRSFETSFDAGFVNLARIQQSVSLIPGKSYDYGFVGAAITRKLGQLNLLASYQFNDQSFTAPICSTIQDCGLTQRHVALLGIYWHTRPIHLDHGSGQPAGAGAVDNDGSNPDGSDVPSHNN